MTSFTPVSLSSRAYASLLLSAWNKGDFKQVKSFLQQAVPGSSNTHANNEHAEMVKAAADGVAAWIEPRSSVADEDLEVSLHLLRHLARH